MRTIVSPGDVKRMIAEAATPTVCKGVAAVGIGDRVPRPAPRAAAPGIIKPDDYRDRLLKYIPAEIIALYMTLQSVMLAADVKRDSPYWWLVFGICAVITPFYLWRVLGITKIIQVMLTTFSFVVWVVALGGPFTQLACYSPLMPAIMLPAYTLVVALINPGAASPKSAPAS
ncbi:MAG: hypothetical protein IMZ44_07760 [Planctomycetes bacterium]|nr:hypothetical protein [Planctomycetota bacterium]